jgi:uncharacterized protein (DUF305 family)
MPLNAADRKFLRLMIPHHKMAIRMADAVAADGSDSRVGMLARKIRTAQTNEIALMERMLKQAGEKSGGSM